MKATSRVLGTTVGSAILVVATTVPAQANDASITFHGAKATYTDVTDKLCARAANDSGSLNDYAIAEILNANGNVVFSKTDQEGGGQSCTANLSIPEDNRYWLRVWDCSTVPGTDCGPSPKKAFYS